MPHDRQVGASPVLLHGRPQLYKQVIDGLDPDEAEARVFDVEDDVDGDGDGGGKSEHGQPLPRVPVRKIVAGQQRRGDRASAMSMTKMIAGGWISAAAARVVVMSIIWLSAGRRSTHADDPLSALGQAVTACVQISAWSAATLGRTARAAVKSGSLR